MTYYLARTYVVDSSLEDLADGISGVPFVFIGKDASSLRDQQESCCFSVSPVPNTDVSLYHPFYKITPSRSTYNHWIVSYLGRALFSVSYIPSEFLWVVRDLETHFLYHSDSCHAAFRLAFYSDFRDLFTPVSTSSGAPPLSASSAAFASSAV